LHDQAVQPLIGGILWSEAEQILAMNLGAETLNRVLQAFQAGEGKMPSAGPLGEFVGGIAGGEA